MKISIFNNGSMCFGLDMSFRPDCVEVIDVSVEDYDKLVRLTHQLDIKTKKLIPVKENERESLLLKICNIPNLTS